MFTSLYAIIETVRRGTRQTQRSADGRDRFVYRAKFVLQEKATYGGWLGTETYTVDSLIVRVVVRIDHGNAQDGLPIGLISAYVEGRPAPPWLATYSGS